MRILFALLTCCLVTTQAWAQNFVQSGAAVGGVAISPDGIVRYRQTGPSTTRPAAQDPSLVYISIPRALEEWRHAKDAHQEAPADVRYLKGLTQITSLFVYPASGATPGDLVIAGHAEGLRTDNALEPLGTRSNRPTLQLEDLVVALRCLEVAGSAQSTRDDSHRDFFGCSIDPPPGNKPLWDEIIKKYEKAPRTTLVAELQKALGPQDVRLFGVPEDSRVAFVMVAADYRLKRLSMGLDTAPPGVGNAMGNEAALARLWFEPAYDPLLVSADGSTYEFRGPRLKVLAGAQVFQPGGEGPAQHRFAANISNKMVETAAKFEAIADLQNVADCFLVAALIRQDGLAQKVGLDLSWLGNAVAYPVASLPTPKTAETVIHISGNTIGTGGVSMAYRSFTGVERTQPRRDEKNADAALSLDPNRPTTTWYLTLAPRPAQPSKPANVR